MTTRREFFRRGALWVAAAAVVEPVARKLWAFPTNPLSSDSGYLVVWDAHAPLFLSVEEWANQARKLEAEIVHHYMHSDSPISNPRGIFA